MLAFFVIVETNREIKKEIEMNILTNLTNLKKLTPNEKSLVTFLVEHPRETLELTPKELADKAYVSVATVYRLLTKANLTGFNELKIEIASSLRGDMIKVEVDSNYPVLETDSEAAMLYRMSHLYQNTLDETVNIFDELALKRSVALLSTAKVIDVYASSSNLYFAKNFQFQFQEIGQVIQVPEEDYMQRLSAANSNEEHVAIVVSYGGRGPTTQAVVELLKENNTPIILMTSTQDNPLASVATEKLYLASTENQYNKISSFSTRFSLLMLFDLLYTAYFNQHPEENKAFKLKNYQKMNRELK